MREKLGDEALNFAVYQFGQQGWKLSDELVCFSSMDKFIDSPDDLGASGKFRSAATCEESKGLQKSFAYETSDFNDWN